MKRRNYKKAIQYLKSLDYRHYINFVITLGFLVLGVFVFPNAICRVAESFRDLGTSLAFYFCELWLDFNTVTPTVIDVQSWQFVPSRFEPLKILPFTWEEFQVMWKEYWHVFIQKETFADYMLIVGDVLFYGSQGLMLLLPIGMLVYMYLQKYLEQENNDYDVESRAVKILKRMADKTYIPIKKWVVDYIEFCKENSFWHTIWIWLWAFYFNFIAIFVEFIAYYLYFIVTFDALSLYRQAYKLILDLSTVVRFIPGIIWAVIITLALELIARSMAHNELQHREARNKGFLSERGVMTIVYGPMGAGKTKTITDMALSQEVRFRDMAFEIIIESDFKFPHFNWATFEQDFKKAIEEHTVFTVPTARKWLQGKYESFEENPEIERIWGYDFERYGMEYDDKLKVWSLWEVLDDYACAYLVYTVQSSLLISNYSIRVDNLYEDLGNFPRWNTDFFDRDTRLIDSYSRHAHILDFDMLRLGKRMLDENPKRYAFGFGVYIISEIDKERKNSPELMTVKANADECNQKNDLFNALVKMSRHACVISNRVFVKIFADLQRPESLGADARELGEIVYIEDHTDMQPTLPFFAPFYVFEAIFAFVFSRFVDLYYNYRFVRSDKILIMYTLKSLTAKLKHFKDRTFNLYGSSKSKLLIESGRMDGDKKEAKYFIQSKKIYSRRYTTDCLSAIFNQYADKNTIGIEDLEEYLTELGTDEENLMQNSFFQNETHHYN